MVKNDAEALLIELKGDLNKLLYQRMKLNSEWSDLEIQINKKKASIVEMEKFKRMLSISDEEKVILKNLSINWKYIGRDESDIDQLFLYEQKPELEPNNKLYYVNDGRWLSFDIYNHLFTFIAPGECYRIIDIIN